MNKKWPYADLSHEAKSCGGPQNFKDNLYNDGFSDGKSHGIIETVAVYVGSAVVFSIPILINEIDKTLDKKGIKKRSAFMNKQEIKITNFILKHINQPEQDDDNNLDVEDVEEIEESDED